MPSSGRRNIVAERWHLVSRSYSWSGLNGMRAGTAEEISVNSLSFIDSYVLLYLLSADSEKADLAEAVMRKRGVINVQVLNEITHVMRRKFSMPWGETNEVLTIIRLVCQVEPLTTEIHDSGRKIAERYQLGLYDAMLAAAAIAAKCETLYSEDMQDRLMINHQLIIRNPFV